MKKLTLVLLVVILCLSLVGCNGTVTPETNTDKVEIKAVLQNFFLAINDQNWSGAKGYCVYGSDAWFIIESIEDAMDTLYYYYYVVTINCFVNISNVSVNGNYGSAKVAGNIVMTADGYSETESINSTFDLQKIGNNWQIYDNQGGYLRK